MLSACTVETNYAPVTDISTIDPIPKSGVHIVKNRETLYSIAWRYGFDYRDLASRNGIKPPYGIWEGQKIFVSGSLEPATKSSPIPVSEPIINLKNKVNTSNWVWPANGRIISNFTGFQKGVNIAGHLYDPIYAAAAGKVVYRGDGLRGYGNLIIIKHNNLYLSAYAHNQVLLVSEGDMVTKGQKIAEMGNTGADQTMLHFEIRRAGKPVDPLSLLPSS